MDFNYSRIIKYLKHQKTISIEPSIRFGIFKPGDPKKILYPFGLIDSGSHATIIDHEFAEAFGIKIKKGRKATICGVGGGSIEGYFHEMGFFIHQKNQSQRPIVYTDYVIFTKGAFPKSMPQQTAILGSQGFFNQLKVILNFPDKIKIEKR